MRLIDSDALDDKLEALVQKYTAQGRPEVAKDYSFVQTVLLTAPTVDAVEVVHGRWVTKETVIRSPFAKNTYCSVCLGETANAHNYCPNCGAKMDGGNEDGVQ